MSTEVVQSSVESYPIVSRYIDFGIDPAFDLDPYAPLAKLAESAPVVAGRNGVFNGIRVPNNFLFPDKQQDVFLALSFDAVRKVASDSETFSSELGYSRTLRLVFGETLMSMDAPRHPTYRRLILPSFSHRMVNEQLHAVARPIINDCLDKIAPAGRGELIGEFTATFPFLIVAKLFGVPPKCQEELEQLVVASLRMGEDPAAALGAFKKMDDVYREVVADHRINPVDDLTLMLMQTELDGNKLTDEEVGSFVKQIVAAGLDTTVRQLANLLYLLLENPDQFDALKADQSLLENAIWEGLRLQAAGGLVPREARRDTEVCGVQIPKGAGVYGVLHSANRDPSRWENPDKFDIRRKRQPIASFGTGPHVCIGQSLSVAEMKIGMEGILDRLKNLRRDPDRWHQVKVRGFQLRSPTQLPVLWDRA